MQLSEDDPVVAAFLSIGIPRDKAIATAAILYGAGKEQGSDARPPATVPAKVTERAEPTGKVQLSTVKELIFSFEFISGLATGLLIVGVVMLLAKH